MDIIIGHRDPNLVAINDFYNPSHNINYLSIIINSEKPMIREDFFEIIRDWLCDLEDK